MCFDNWHELTFNMTWKLYSGLFCETNIVRHNAFCEKNKNKKHMAGFVQLGFSFHLTVNGAEGFVYSSHIVQL